MNVLTPHHYATLFPSQANLSADPAVLHKTPRQSSSPRAQALAASRQAQTGQPATLWVRGCRGGHPKAVLIAVAQALEQLPQDFAQGKPSTCGMLYFKSWQAGMIPARGWGPVTNSIRKEKGQDMMYPSEPRTALEGSPNWCCVQWAEAAGQGGAMTRWLCWKPSCWPCAPTTTVRSSGTSGCLPASAGS